jgi:hypothetical protein
MFPLGGPPPWCPISFSSCRHQHIGARHPIFPGDRVSAGFYDHSPLFFSRPPPCQSPPDDTRPLDTPSVSFPSPMRTAQTSYPLNGMDSPVVTTEAAAQARSSASQPPTALAPELRSCHRKTTIVRQLSLPPDPEPVPVPFLSRVRSIGRHTPCRGTKG